MTKQMKTAMAAMLMVGTLPMMAQSSQTDVVKVAPGQTKKTVIHRKNGATDTVISEGESTGAKKRRVSRRRAVTHREPVESATAREIRELKEQQAAQQAEINALTQANSAKDAALAQATQNAQAAEAQAQSATAAAQSVSSSVQAQGDQVQALKSNVSDLQTTNAGLAATISANKVELKEEIESPLAIHYKGVKITPVAFFAFEGVYRERAMNSDINTPFNSTPFPGATEGHISELNFTARQSRLGGLFEGQAANFKLSGYFESDFLSAGVTSNNNQSNSYTFRVRQIWGKAETKGGFAVTGGQTWTLATEDGKGTDARTEKLPNTVDSQYMVGYSWARQPGIRIQQRFGDVNTHSMTVAISAEQAQTQLGTTANAPSNFIFGGAGVAGGLYNAYNGTYANNVAPDVFAKVAFDSKHSHFELGGLGRWFRDEYTPEILSGTTGLITGYTNTLVKNTKFGGGAFGSARVSLGHFVDVAAQGMYGDGTGRYGSSQLGDVTVHPDGTLALIHNDHGLFSVETHPTKKLDVYAYYGAEYNQRTVYTGSTTTGINQQIGYGVRNAIDTGCAALPAPTVAAPVGTGGGVNGSDTTANCASPTRLIQEGMFGFTYKVINSPKYGRLQYQATYSYLQKNTWSGITAGSAAAPTAFGSGKAENNMIHVSMRYYLP
jgi:hypothetical protein